MTALIMTMFILDFPNVYLDKRTLYVYNSKEQCEKALENIKHNITNPTLEIKCETMK